MGSLGGFALESVVVALIPVVPAVVPPLSSFRGRAGATGGDGLSHASRHRACRVARVPKYRGRVPCGETRGEVGGTLGMPAGQTGGAGMEEGGACPDHARVRLRIAPRRGCGRRGGRVEGQGRDHAARAHRGRGPLWAGPDDVGGGPPCGHRRLRRVGHRGGTSGGSPTGVTRGGGNAPDGGRRQRPPGRRGNAARLS